MTGISLLGIPHDDNSSFMKGAAEAPALIRARIALRRLQLVERNAASIWASTGLIVDHGDIRFDGAGDPWELIERVSGARWIRAIR